MKIVVNKCFGGFAVSRACAEFMASLGCERAKKELEKSIEEKHYYGFGYVEGMDGGYDRTSEYLIKAVEALGKEASGDCSNLKVIEIPDDVDYEIDEYDGIESVHEKHRSW